MTLRGFIAALLPRPARERLLLRSRLVTAVPPAGNVAFGDLRRLQPVSRAFGSDRGEPIDRYYIESFLAAHRSDIRGNVLEIGDATYTRAFGTNVTRSDVLHVAPGNDQATLVGDLAARIPVEENRFDCVLLTQTLPFIFDARAAVAEVHRIVKPGGVVLATVPGISQISRYDMDRWGDYWRFTSLGARRLFETAFSDVTTTSYGNVLSAVAFLEGLGSEELTREELGHADADYEVTIGVRAVK